MIMTYGMHALCTDGSFVVLVVGERACQMGPNSVRRREDFPSQKQILGARYCNQ